MQELGLGAMLLAAARQHAGRPALTVGADQLTYDELFARAGAITAAIEDADIAAGGLVAILASRAITAYAAIVGTLVAGCGYVPLSPAFPAERNRMILAVSGARALIVDGTCAADLDVHLADLPVDITVIAPDGDQIRPALPNRRLTASDLRKVLLKTITGRAIPDENAIAYLLFTSGTTGVPKGVPINHHNVITYLQAMHGLIPLTAEDRVLQAVDLTFDLSVHDMMLTWLNGGELHVAPYNGAILAPRFIAGAELTACLLVPSAAARAAESGLLKPRNMESLRFSAFGGEALPTSTAALWRHAAPNAVIFNLYGPTEATINTSAYRLDPDRAMPTSVAPIGWPLGEQRMMVLTADGKAAADEAGEILLSGPQMTTGYWHAPHLDTERFVTIEGTRWYRTGDLGRYTQDHGFVFLGRLDRQLKIRGYRVELQEVEGALREATRRERIAVIAWPRVSPGNADGLVAFIAGLAMDVDALRQACRRMLPSYMIPDRFEFVDDLPLNANGKVDYNALSQRLQGVAAVTA